MHFLFVRGSTVAALASVVLALAPAATWAQTGSVTGTVIDAQSGRPVSYATVMVTGTRIARQSDEEGRFTLLDVPVGTQVLRATIIGYQPAEREVSVTTGATATVTFELTRSVIGLEQVVVTGQGVEVTRRELATNVSTLTEADIRVAPVVSVEQLIQGRVAGATVNAVSAQPGTAGLVNFRGISSVFGSQTPVVYIDGVRVDNSSATSGGTGGENSSALADLLTSDIERVEITRGGAASTLFGSDAAAGVIQIFTRRGRAGTPEVTFRVDQGSDVPELKYMFDSQLAFEDEVLAGDEPRNFLRDNFFKNAHHQNYSVQVSGGSQDVTYHVSGRIQQAGGVQPKNDNQLYTLRGRVDAHLSPRLTVDFSANYTRNNFGRLYNGTAIADPLTAFEVGDAKFFTNASTLEEALEIFLMPSIDEGVNRFIVSSGGTWRQTDNWISRLTIGMDFRTNRQRQFQPIGFVAGREEGQVFRFDREFQSITMELNTSYTHQFSDLVNGTFVVGGQGFRENSITSGLIGTGFALPGTPDVDDAADITAFEGRQQLFNGGVFGQTRFGIADKVFLEAGLRLDASSTFGDRVTGKTYPKLGATYLPSSEPFFRDLLGTVVDELKLRVAWGEAGKFPPPFLRDQTFTAIPFRGESAPRFDNPGNPDLAPEVTSTLEYGFDMAFLRQRVGFALTVFDARTRDAMFFVPEPPLTGQGVQIRNVGEIRNTGIELDLSAQVLDLRNVQLSFRTTYATVNNRVTDMGGVAPFFIGAGMKHVAEGRQVGAWFVTTPIDTNGDGLADGSERLYTGKGPIPTRSGSVSTTLTLWNRLTLSGNGDWAAGHEVFDWGSVWATFNGIFRREIIEDGYVFPRRHDLAGTEVGRYSQSAARSAFLVPGDFFKLRELSARYTLPDEIAARANAQRATVFLSARNVAIFSKTKMIDPELNGVGSPGQLQLGGESSVTLSPPRQFRFGIEATF